MRFDVLTLFPEMFPGYLGQSLLRRAIDAGLVQVELHNLRDWATGPHAAVDDRPFGGGPGMVLKAEPVVEAVEAVQAAQQTPAWDLDGRGDRLQQDQAHRSQTDGNGQQSGNLFFSENEPPQPLLAVRASERAKVNEATTIASKGVPVQLKQIAPIFSGPSSARVSGPPYPPGHEENKASRGGPLLCV